MFIFEDLFFFKKSYWKISFFFTKISILSIRNDIKSILELLLETKPAELHLVGLMTEFPLMTDLRGPAR
jgi:hypothetical protein